MSGKMTVVEGSYAIAHSVKVCRPNVISAYPITPQTHIVEDLSQFMAMDTYFLQVKLPPNYYKMCCFLNI